MRYADPRIPPAPASRIDFMSGTYLCPELANTSSRGGAMTAHALPSRMGDRLYHRDGRITDLAGNPTTEISA